MSHAQGNAGASAQEGTARMLSGLLAGSHLIALEEGPSLIEEHAPQAGLSQALIYLADLQQQVLRLLTERDDHAGEGADGQVTEMRIDATLAGRVFQETREQHLSCGEGEGGSWWVPLLDGTERLGVLRISAAREDEASRQAVLALASLVALLVVSKRPYSDSYAQLVRTKPMHVAAEMQWKLIPPLTFANREVNRGHHPPVLIRGRRWISTLDCPPAHPMGLALGLPVTLCHQQLEPGDRVLLYTDGITEARGAHGHEFGLERFTDFIIRHTADGCRCPRRCAA